jgi:hypothetical protein
MATTSEADRKEAEQNAMLLERLKSGEFDIIYSRTGPEGRYYITAKPKAKDVA